MAVMMVIVAKVVVVVVVMSVCYVSGKNLDHFTSYAMLFCYVIHVTSLVIKEQCQRYVFQSANMLIVVNNLHLYHLHSLTDYCCYYYDYNNTVCFPVFIHIVFLMPLTSFGTATQHRTCALCWLCLPEIARRFVAIKPEDLLNGFCHKCCEYRIYTHIIGSQIKRHIAVKMT